MNDWTKTRTVEPGNGTRYRMVWGEIAGEPFVALPDMHSAATMSLHPAEEGYVMAKLGINRPDALAVLAVLRGEL